MEEKINAVFMKLDTENEKGMICASDDNFLFTHFITVTTFQNGSATMTISINEFQQSIQKPSSILHPFK